MKFKTIITVFLGLCMALSCEKENTSNGSGALDYTSLQAKSVKRGVSFNFGQLPDLDIPALGPAICWSYNWSPGSSDAAFAQFEKYGMDFCPMAWNANWSEDTFRAFKRAHPKCEYLLAYNEPNLTDQANMTPAQAAQDWPRLVAIAKELGMKIIAPAMNYGTLADYHDPWKWMDEFFAQPGVNLDDVSGLALHCYMGSAQSMKQFVDKFKKYGKPLWLTEFCNWANNNISLEAQMNYMVEAINLLESDDQVQRYAWFIPRGNGDAQCHNSLLSSSKPFGLTDLGKVFVNMSTLDKNLYYSVGQVIPAEHYSGFDGVLHLAPCTDAKGILEMRDLKKGASAQWQVEIPSDGKYSLEVRYNTYFETSLKVIVDGKNMGTLDLSNTQNEWSNRKVDVELTKGKHTLELGGNTAFPVALNWIRITNN